MELNMFFYYLQRIMNMSLFYSHNANHILVGHANGGYLS